MYAVTVEPLNAICFVTSRPEGDLLDVQEGVEIDIPSNFDLSARGAEPPRQILCRSTENPKHYKIFKDLRDIDRTAFEETGANFGGVFSGKSWGRFIRELSSALPVLSIEDDEEPAALRRPEAGAESP